MVDSVASYAANAEDTEAAVARESEPALAQAVLAHRRGDYQSAIDQLLAVRDTIRRIGGSLPQRHLFQEMMIDAALRAGRIDQAKILLAAPLDRRPRNAWGWRQYAQALDRFGDDGGAARSRAEAEQLMAA
jgi:predicted Zn-dependent protease